MKNKGKRRTENGNFCIWLPLTCFTESVYDPALNTKNKQSSNQLFVKC